MDTKLQETITDEKDSCVRYISNLSEIKLNDKLEALYDMDNKWYRVNVTDISNEAVTIYFLDFGNSLTLNEAESNKILRFRNYYKSKEEKEIFDLEYQAVQCIYSLSLNSTLEEFINKLAELNIDEGFDIKITDISKDQKGYMLYNVVLLSDDTSAEANFQFEDVEPVSLKNISEDMEYIHNEKILDLEVSLILDEKFKQKKFSIFALGDHLTHFNLDFSKEHSVSLSHIINTDAFYVQSHDKLLSLIEHQQKIQSKLLNSQPQINFKCEDPIFHIGDFIFARYLVDGSWYRALVTLVTRSIENSNEVNDGYSYEVYFVDYGNTEYDMTSYNLRSIQSVFDSIPQDQYKNELNSIIDFPFQAICCQLENKKVSTRNTEILKALMTECFNFKLKVISVTNHKISNDVIENIIEIKKNIVHLFSENILLDNQFESVTIAAREPDTRELDQNSEIMIAKTLKPNFYNFKISYFDDQNIYIHLAEDYSDLIQLQKDLNEIKLTDSLIFFDKRDVLHVNKFVLAKFYEEDRINFSWYRARIINIAEKISVFYLDYGNTDNSLILSDLARIPDKFNFAKYQQYSYRIEIKNIKLNMDEHLDLLSEYFMNEDSKLKVIDQINKNENEIVYNVELWDKELKLCFNYQVDSNYKFSKNSFDKSFDSKNININHTQLELSKISIVNTGFMFIDNYQKPFYFCLKNDMEKRENIKLSMNEFYKSLFYNIFFYNIINYYFKLKF